MKSQIEINKKYINNEKINSYLNENNFFNRELSWLEFNKRVLKEAKNKSLPLLERIKFISIFFSNLDEFYMIRVAGIKEQFKANINSKKIDGLTPSDELIQIENEVSKMLEDIFSLWSQEIIPLLSSSGIQIIRMNDLNDFEKRKVTDYFKNNIFPILTPLAFDPGRPFPYISNLSISFAILINKPNGENHFGRVKIPNIISRLQNLDRILNKNEELRKDENIRFLWLDDIISNNLHLLFPGVEVVKAFKFRITRNTDIEIQEDEADDLLEVIEQNIRQRKFASVVRLEVEKDMPEFMIDILTKNLELSRLDVQVSKGPLGLSDIIKLYDLRYPELKYPEFHPVRKSLTEDDTIFNLMKQKDILLHHPYDSFNPVIDFIKEASEDPNVLAIKQTLYRIGSNSPIVKYLIEAAERNKQVAVLVELKARFDEEKNIYWARELEKAGVHVVYGLVGLKTHAKMTLIVRREKGKLNRYVHLSSGNYNPITARLYTDMGLFTNNSKICNDVSELFNFLTGYSEKRKHNKLFVSPFNTRDKILELIDREIGHVNDGYNGRIILKLNSLVDQLIISALYEASKAGVKIDLIVRGVCCLKPNIPGLSDNISVRSIIGRYLEHSRIYYFMNNNSEEVYISSADLMPRNLDRRVEITFPIENSEVKESIINTILFPALNDNTKAHILYGNGRYVLNRPVYTEKSLNSQDWLIHNSIKQERLLSEFNKD